MQAMREKAEQIAGKPAEIIEFARHSRFYLLASDRVRVEVRELECSVTSSS